MGATSSSTITEENVSKILAKSIISTIEEKTSKSAAKSDVVVRNSHHVHIARVVNHVKILQQLNVATLRASNAQISSKFATDMATAMNQKVAGMAVSSDRNYISHKTSAFLSTVSNLSSVDKIRQSIEEHQGLYIMDSSDVQVDNIESDVSIEQTLKSLAADLSRSEGFEQFVASLNAVLKTKTQGPVTAWLNQIGLTFTQIVWAGIVLLIIILVLFFGPSSSSSAPTVVASYPPPMYAMSGP